MKRYAVIFLLFSVIQNNILAKRDFITIAHPDVVCVLVVDQLAIPHLQKLKDKFRGGLKLFLNEGLRYENAHFNTAVPGTAPDHTTLATGAYASVHGVVANAWFNNQNQLIPAEQDDRFPILGGNGQKITGASAHNIMADTLSDQIALFRSPQKSYHAVAVSVKARAAICCAGKNGVAFWFNERTGEMTSSTAYFKTLPPWIIDFNKQYNPFNAGSITWKPFYNNPAAYNQYIIPPHADKSVENLFNTTIAIQQDGHIIDQDLEKFERTPAMDNVLFPFAKQCFDTYKPAQNGLLLFWFSISSLDKIGHIHGPWSNEAIDYLYHLDHQLLDFMEHVQKSVGKNNVLFILTADHGTMQIPEQINQAPVPLGHRVYTKTLIDQINSFIEQKQGIVNAVIGYQAPGFYINRQIDPAQKEVIAQDVKDILRTLPQIRQVWTASELVNACDKNALPYKNQFYEGRSPDVICEPTPYSLIAKSPTGVDHASPYNYDTQVPLIFYWPGHLPAQRIYDAVSMTQLARTLSYIMDVPPPSASGYSILPALLPQLQQKKKR